MDKRAIVAVGAVSVALAAAGCAGVSTSASVGYTPPVAIPAHTVILAPAISWPAPVPPAAVIVPPPKPSPSVQLPGFRR